MIKKQNLLMKNLKKIPCKLLFVFLILIVSTGYGAVEEFIDIGFSKSGGMQFSRSGIGLEFLTVRLYVDDSSRAVFNRLPFKTSLPEGKYPARVEVTDRSRKLHTNYYSINKDSQKFICEVQIKRQGKLIRVPEGTKGLKFLYDMASGAEAEKGYGTAVELYHKLIVLGTEPEMYRDVVLRLIDIYRANKEYKQLYYFCRQFLRYFPRDDKTPDAVFLVAELLFSYGKYKEAAWLYERGNVLSVRPETYFQLGYCYEQIYDYEKAIHWYEKFLTDAEEEDRDKTAVSVFRLAGLNYLLEDYFAGKAELEEDVDIEETEFVFEDTKEKETTAADTVLKEDKKEEIRYTEEERKRFSYGYYAQAYHLYQSFVIKYSEHYLHNEALFRFSGLCYDLRRYNESLGYLARLSSREQISEDMKRKIIYRQGLCYLGWKDYNRAVNIFTGMQRTYRGTEEATNAQFYAGLGYYRLADYMSSYGHLTGFIGRAEDSPLVPDAEYYSLACLFYEAVRKNSGGENIEKLKGELEPLLEQLKQMVFMYPDSSIVPEAEELIAKGYEILTGEDDLFEKEGLYMDLNSYVQAVLEKYPNGPDKLFYDEGMKKVAAKEYEQAGGYFLVLLQKFPDSGFLTDTRYQLGLVYGNLTAYRQGIEMLRALVAETPKHQLADDSLYLIGYYCLCLESYNNAKRAFELLLANYPDSPRAQWAKRDLQLLEERGLLNDAPE